MLNSDNPAAGCSSLSQGGGDGDLTLPPVLGAHPAGHQGMSCPHCQKGQLFAEELVKGKAIGTVLLSLLALAERGIKLGATECIPDGLSSFPADHTSPHPSLIFQLQSPSSSSAPDDEVRSDRCCRLPFPTVSFLWLLKSLWDF